MALTLKTIGRSISHLVVRRFRWLIAVVVVCVFGLGFLFFLRPKLAEIQKVGVFDLRRTKDELALKETILSSTQELVSKYEELQLDEVAKLKALLPTEAGIPDLFVQIEAIAIASKFELANVSFAEPSAERTTQAGAAATDEEGLTAKTQPAAAPTAPSTPKALTGESIKKINVTFSVAGDGGYDSFKTFLSTVESSVRLLDIQSISYTPSEDGQYQINAVTYYFQ
jgi:Tfp pilus assembly protein PilO